MAEKHLTTDRVREVFHYDKESGIFSRKKNGQLKPITKCSRNDGYLATFIDGKKYLIHRLIWLYVNGCWPNKEIDHIDRNRINNKFSNLREVNDAQNRSLNKNTSSGVRGVFWNKQCNKWGAYINVNHKRTYFGVFETLDEAAAVRKEAERQLFTHSESNLI